MQYLSFQVIKGLSYLREKHKIMHRGQSLFYLPNTIYYKYVFKGKIFKYMKTHLLVVLIFTSQ